MTAAIQAFLPGQGIQQKVGGHRQGTLDRLAFPFDTGVPGLNLSFTRDVVPDGFYSPRHRHCWDQFRFVLEGGGQPG